MKRATRGNEMFLSPHADAISVEAKCPTCLQNPIATIHWIRAQAVRSGWRCHRCLLSIQRSKPPSWSIHQCWPKRTSSLCFSVAVQNHCHQGFNLAIQCVHYQSRHPSASMLQEQAAGESSGLSWLSQPPTELLPLGIIEACAEQQIPSGAWRSLENCSGWPAANCHLQYFCSPLPWSSPPKRSVLALPMNCLAHTQCTIWSTFIYLEAFWSDLYNINGFIFSSPL